MKKNMLYLIDATTGEILEESDADFKEFIEKTYGGLYPYKDPKTGLLMSRHPLNWAIRYDAYWSQYPPQ